MGQRKKFDKAFKEQVVLRILAEESTIGELQQIIKNKDLNQNLNMPIL